MTRLPPSGAGKCGSFRPPRPQKGARASSRASPGWLGPRLRVGGWAGPRGRPARFPPARFPPAPPPRPQSRALFLPRPRQGVRTLGRWSGAPPRRPRGRPQRRTEGLLPRPAPSRRRPHRRGRCRPCARGRTGRRRRRQRWHRCWFRAPGAGCRRRGAERSRTPTCNAASERLEVRPNTHTHHARSKSQIRSPMWRGRGGPNDEGRAK
mmetsp:Transcript_12933/g.30492  ORF Transcript_12933/g.30492 Transcript_12933/m.30492 type:complete len:208 (+) Transcript_12933:157-780(+)